MPYEGQTSFGGGPGELVNIVEDICIKGGGTLEENKAMQFFNRQLLHTFNPDINGYSLCFMLPPPFIGLDLDGKYDDEYAELFRKLTVFASVDFSPPTRQVSTQKLSARTGGVPYATQVEPTEQCTVSYIDNTDLDIFNFHAVWLEYIHDLTLGYIDVPNIYIDPGNPNYGGLDYAGSIYMVRYDVSMQNIMYVGKVTGVYPQGLPNKEIIGQRSTNEVTVIPFTYFAGWYEETLDSSHPIWSELESHVLGFYGG